MLHEQYASYAPAAARGLFPQRQGQQVQKPVQAFVPGQQLVLKAQLQELAAEQERQGRALGPELQEQQGPQQA
jgi:hypothetical protein